MSQFHILVVAKAIPPHIGGIEAYSAEVASAYVRAGFAVTLLTPNEDLTPCSDGRLTRGRDSAKTLPQWRAFIKVLAAIRRLRQKRWKLVHSTSWRMALPVLLAGLGKRLIITVHGREVTGQRGLMAQLAAFVLRKATLLVYVSETTRREACAYLPSIASVPSVVAWNGTSYPDEELIQFGTPLSRHPLRILTVARLVKRKNLPFAVAAVGVLRSRIKRPVSYVITGTGPELGAIEKAIADAGMTHEQVELVGYVCDDKLQQLYRDAHVFFHPQSSAHDASDVEGFGISIVDAMSYGVPVICGRDGGPSEYVRHGENGLLISGQDIGEAVDCLELLAGDQAISERIGSGGRALVRKHMTWSNHVESIVNAANAY